MAKIGTKGLIPAVYRANLIQYKGHWSIGENEEETLGRYTFFQSPR